MVYSLLCVVVCVLLSSLFVVGVVVGHVVVRCRCLRLFVCGVLLLSLFASECRCLGLLVVVVVVLLVVVVCCRCCC